MSAALSLVPNPADWARWVQAFCTGWVLGHCTSNFLSFLHFMFVLSYFVLSPAIVLRHLMSSDGKLVMHRPQLRSTHLGSVSGHDDFADFLSCNWELDSKD